jgi:hypothetical protein
MSADAGTMDSGKFEPCLTSLTCEYHARGVLKSNGVSRADRRLFVLKEHDVSSALSTIKSVGLLQMGLSPSTYPLKESRPPVITLRGALKIEAICPALP